MKKINRAGRVLQHEYLRVFAAGCIILFAILPLGTLAFHVNGEDLAYLAGNKSFRQSVGNSLIYASVSALITTGLALMAAYLLNTSSIRKKNLLAIILTLGMLVPTISVGLGLRILFGKNGFIDLMTGEYPLAI